MVTPNDAISAAIAATSSHDPDSGKKDRSPSAPASSGHRRSISGGFSSSLAFLRSGHNHETGIRSDTPSPIIEEPPSPRTGSAMSSMQNVLQQRKSRTRKGSLRKSAMMAVGNKKRMEGSELQRSSSSLEEVPLLGRHYSDSAIPDHGGHIAPLTPITPTDLPTPRPLPVPPPVPMVTHPVHGDPSKILEVTDAKEPFPDLKRPFKAKSSTTSTTTDDDDSLTSPSDLVPHSLQKMSMPSDSYFPSQPAQPAFVGQSVPQPRSPLGALPPSLPASPPSEWDYSETRWWGWIILCVTWIVFVVGMGSCLGVWSWAWDVGETPYAPPELEDDPTLPIVGYYPALMVLTCVMAWVWVTVAWVGMKYFRHANISGDEE